MRLGITEILLILVLALVIFGGSKLSGVGKALGQNYTPIYVVLGVINIALAVLVFTMRPKQSKEQTA